MSGKKPRRQFRFDFLIKEWFGGTRRLTFEERGLYIDLMGLIYEHVGIFTLPPIDEFCRMLAADRRKLRRVFEALVKKGKILCKGDAITNPKAAEIMGVDLADFGPTLPRLLFEVGEKSARSPVEVRPPIVENQPSSNSSLYSHSLSQQSKTVEASASTPVAEGPDGLDIPDFLRRGANGELPGLGLPEAQPTALSVAPVQDAAPILTLTPIDLRKEIWRRGIAFLVTSAGMTEARARPLLGKWRQLVGDVVMLDVLSDCEGKCASDPISWIEAAIKRRRNGNGHGINVEDRKREDREAVLRAVGLAPAEPQPGAGDPGGAGPYRP